MKKILLIEDNQEVRENVAEILELASYEVTTAPNGKTGIEYAKKDLPDLIICDIMMPELDGFGVLHLLSKNIKTYNIPFIFLTAKAEKEDIRKGMSLGADDYLTKPFDDLELLDAVELRLKKHDTLVETFAHKDQEGLNDFLHTAKNSTELNKLLLSEHKIQKVPKKLSLYSEGSFPSYLYFISKGKMKTVKIDQTGNELITGLYKEGDFLGYLDLLEQTQYKESAFSLEDSEVCMIKREDFFTLLYNNRDVANKFIKMLSDNVVEREERLLNLAYHSVRKRVAEALLFLQQKYQKENTEFVMAISREDLSDIVGSSKETVIRTLSDFKEEGLILIAGSKITVLKPDKLAALRN